MDYRIEILKAFLENETLVKEMKNCDHGENGKYNPYHLEGSVWTHTMLVYNQANSYDMFELIMALCHDIGKVIVRKVKDDGKVTFYGHAEASIQPTIDFIYYLYKKNIMSRTDINFFIDGFLSPMSNHMLYYQNSNKLNHLTGNYFFLERAFKKIAKMDVEGSISKNGKIEDNIELKEYNPKKWNDKLPVVTIWTGLPGSGKDYLAEQTDDIILSFDDIRVDCYLQYLISINDHTIRTPSEVYDEAWKYCNEKKINLMKMMSKNARHKLSLGHNVSICNTSLTRKARKAIINSIGVKYNYVVKQVLVPSKIILERNSKRTNHNIPVSVIHRMMNNMTMATHFEKHINDIQYILNIEDE